MGKEAQRSEGAFHRKVETTDTKLVPTWEIIQGDALKLLALFIGICTIGIIIVGYLFNAFQCVPIFADINF